MTRFMVFMFVVALAGCASQPTEIVRGNAQSVMVRSSSNEESLVFAKRHCSQFGRNAKYKGELAPCDRCGVREWIYDCADY